MFKDALSLPLEKQIVYLILIFVHKFRRVPTSFDFKANLPMKEKQIIDAVINI